MTSTWMTVPPPSAARPTCSPRRAKSADKIEGASSIKPGAFGRTTTPDFSTGVQRVSGGLNCGVQRLFAYDRRFSVLPTTDGGFLFVRTTNDRRPTTVLPPVAPAAQKPETSTHESDRRNPGQARLNPAAPQNAARDWRAPPGDV